MTVIKFFIGVLLLFECSSGFKVYRAWTEQHWCDSIYNPHWPFSYSKNGALIESKGRTMSNLQHFGHECEQRGTKTKCFRCEDIDCGENFAERCHMQMQGQDWTKLPKNVPTVSDTPWAVGGSHRNDFGSTTEGVCVLLSGGHCIKHDGTDYSSCDVRCWGTDLAPPVPNPKYQRNKKRTFPEPHDHHEFGVYNTSHAVKYPDIDYPGQWRDEWYGTRELGWTYPSTNGQPQGSVLTLAGDGTPGFVDGPAHTARFNRPTGLAVDRTGAIYVADTFNNRIRRIDGTTFTVSTIAGSGLAGYTDGPGTEAKFDHPTGITLYYDWRLGSTGAPPPLVLVVADTDNHRIRKIVDLGDGNGWVVSTLSGLKAQSPRSGFADGAPDLAQFNHPTGIVANDEGIVFVADTYNHLIREIQQDGLTSTLAGKAVEQDQTPGCPFPCLKGKAGYKDGDLDEAQFYFPSDVAIGKKGTVLVTEGHRIRRINRKEFTEIEGQGTADETSSQVAGALIQGVGSAHRVVTVAGQVEPGDADDNGQNAQFNSPQGIVMASDGHIYVADTTNCRLRRISRSQDVARQITCTTTMTQIIRPSGCASYDPPVDSLYDKTSARVYDTHFNYHHNDSYRIKNCLGTPPIDIGISFNNRTAGPRAGTKTQEVNIKEATGDWTTIKVRCPVGCSAGSPIVVGTNIYTDYSNVCAAAIHDGALSNTKEGLITVTIREGKATYSGSSRNGITSESRASEWSRSFSVEHYKLADVEVQTIAGAPAAGLEDSCGHRDAKPPQEARFETPSGIALFTNHSLASSAKSMDTDIGALRPSLLYIADVDGHRIRYTTAVCSKPCENGGLCVAPEKCQCTAGWTGPDCTTPICTTSCGPRQLCTGPDKCTCIPGYSGFPECTTPQCVQTCRHGSTCVAPDTCSCKPGWFDANCTTPVCSQTCGNGGNCTAPDTCRCPTDWTGSTCRVPVCEQSCMNGGLCIAPNTCRCPPKWSGHDCSKPVCTQGFFKPDPIATVEKYFSPSSWRESHWLKYVPCNYTSWCESTNEFDCSQELRNSTAIHPLWGEKNRFITGRQSEPSECMLMELDVDVGTLPYSDSVEMSVPFSFVDVRGRYSKYARKSPVGLYESLNPDLPSGSIVKQTEYPYLERPEKDGGGPDGAGNYWDAPGVSVSDRQVAVVQLRNVTQGVYVCANGGDCIEPDVCRCKEGWVGFDCRIPVCRQGYFEEGQDGRERLWAGPLAGGSPSYEGPHNNDWRPRDVNGLKQPHYFPNWWDGDHVDQAIDGRGQGGYECSLRTHTQWEWRRCKGGSCTEFLHDHPNFYSMFTDWPVAGIDDGTTRVEGFPAWRHEDWKLFTWPIEERPDFVTHEKNIGWTPAYSRIIGKGNQTQEGYRRDGWWEKTGAKWTKGSCISKYRRTCLGDDQEKELINLSRGSSDIIRWPYPFGNNSTETKMRNLWSKTSCSDAEAWRTAPDAATSSTGNLPVFPSCQDHSEGSIPTFDTDATWRARITRDIWHTNAVGRWRIDGGQCTDYVERGCYNNGTCVAPDLCRCAPGYVGYDCTIPTCDQKCLHSGNCTKPNMCTCERGWEGDDCSIPICAQECRNNGTCVAPDTCECDRWWTDWADPRGKPLYRQPSGDPMFTGYTGYDCSTPICVQALGFVLNEPGGTKRFGGMQMLLYGDPPYNNIKSKNMYEGWENSVVTGALIGKQYTESMLRPMYVPWTDCNAEGANVTSCWKKDGSSDEVGQIMRNDGYSFQSGCSEELSYTGTHFNTSTISTTRISNEHLCGVMKWEQGDYRTGRYDLANHNYYLSVYPEYWATGTVKAGEGIYACFNRGSCVKPDQCSCPDGYVGHNCDTPLCRHINQFGDLVSCINGGRCLEKDRCKCVRTPSQLYLDHPKVARAKPDFYTGYMGTDCSIPVCVQATHFDPDCRDVTSGGEGCFRCKNGGNCTAPDHCTCTTDWTGYDCSIPVCGVNVNAVVVTDMNTVDPYKIQVFEMDPCGTASQVEWTPEGSSLTLMKTRGNCTAPKHCTCLCRSIAQLDEEGELVNGPWKDPLARELPLGYIIGTENCRDGYEGIKDSGGNFISCHLKIKVPTYFEANSQNVIIGAACGGVFLCIIYFFVRRRLKIIAHKKKIERRRSRKSSLTDPTAGSSAFGHQ